MDKRAETLVGQIGSAVSCSLTTISSEIPSPRQEGGTVLSYWFNADSDEDGS